MRQQFHKCNFYLAVQRITIHVSKLSIDKSKVCSIIKPKEPHMTRAEFIEIYINVSEEAQNQIEETLRSYQTEPASPVEDLCIDRRER